MRIRQKTKDRTFRQAVNRRGQLLRAGVLALTLSACAPVIDNRGYFFDSRSVDRIKKGETTQSIVRESFGSPTSVSKINNEAYYYIYSRFLTESYRAPREVERKVLAIYFDGQKTVRDVGIYALQDGIIVPIVERTTKTQGTELTALQQIFSNLGRFGDNSPTQF
ncbi:MAG: outer membrane protein assembly factor BamE [Parvibaculales bacterium]|nr:outer membrane protein assembly factor BamE [Alphaproteobacteria bacterium]